MGAGASSPKNTTTTITNQSENVVRNITDNNIKDTTTNIQGLISSSALLSSESKSDNDIINNNDLDTNKMMSEIQDLLDNIKDIEVKDTIQQLLEKTQSHFSSFQPLSIAVKSMKGLIGKATNNNVFLVKASVILQKISIQDSIAPEITKEIITGVFSSIGVHLPFISLITCGIGGLIESFEVSKENDKNIENILLWSKSMIEWLLLIAMKIEKSQGEMCAILFFNLHIQIDELTAICQKHDSHWRITKIILSDQFSRKLDIVKTTVFELKQALKDYLDEETLMLQGKLLEGLESVAVENSVKLDILMEKMDQLNNVMINNNNNNNNNNIPSSPTILRLQSVAEDEQIFLLLLQCSHLPEHSDMEWNAFVIAFEAIFLDGIDLSPLEERALKARIDRMKNNRVSKSEWKKFYANWKLMGDVTMKEYLKLLTTEYGSEGVNDRNTITNTNTNTDSSSSSSSGPGEVAWSEITKIAGTNINEKLDVNAFALAFEKFYYDNDELDKHLRETLNKYIDHLDDGKVSRLEWLRFYDKSSALDMTLKDYVKVLYEDSVALSSSGSGSGSGSGSNSNNNNNNNNNINNANKKKSPEEGMWTSLVKFCDLPNEDSIIELSSFCLWIEYFFYTGKTMPQEVADILRKIVDRSKDGYIDKSEFLAFLNKVKQNNSTIVEYLDMLLVQNKYTRQQSNQINTELSIENADTLWVSLLNIAGLSDTPDNNIPIDIFVISIESLFLQGNDFSNHESTVLKNTVDRTRSRDVSKAEWIKLVHKYHNAECKDLKSFIQSL